MLTARSRTSAFFEKFCLHYLKSVIYLKAVKGTEREKHAGTANAVEDER